MTSSGPTKTPPAMEAEPSIRALVGPLPRACSHCPWRLSNQGTPHPHGFYRAANLRRLWTGLRTGQAPGMTCHPTDPRMVEWEGYEDTADREVTNECAGATALVLREVMRFQALTFEVDAEKDAGARTQHGEALRRYKAAQPRGLTKAALADAVWRYLTGKAIPSAQLVNDPTVGYAPLGVWDPEILRRASR